MSTALALATLDTFRNQIVHTDALTLLRSLPDASVHCLVTSPPYFGLRDYGEDEQIGLEDTPDQYVARLVDVFREARRVLRDDGVAWLNLGDSYANDGKWGGTTGGKHAAGLHGHSGIGRRKQNTGLKPKDLIGIPWRVAFALQADGWWLRSDIIWCLSGGTRVYARTQKGEMPMTIKDMVRLDPSTVQLWNGEKWTQVLGWNESPRPDAPIEIELRSGEKIGCTPNHEWPTQRGLVRADQLRVGDVIDSCRLPEPDEPQQPLMITNEAAWFAGLYLAEGSRGKDGQVIQIASHADETERFERLCNIADAYGGTCKMHQTSENGATINLYGPMLTGIIDMFVSGKSAHDKHLNPRIWNYGDTFLRNVLAGYLSGDGHYDDKNDRWRLGFTRNYNLANDLRTLCARLGIKLRLKLATSGEFKTFRGELRWNWTEHHNAKQDSEIVSIGRSRARKFWDIGVADEPHTFALASSVLTHNSKPNPMPESVTDRPTKAHEYVFLLTKSAQYWYDADAVREGTNVYTRNAGGYRNDVGTRPRDNTYRNKGGLADHDTTTIGRNKRTVWKIATCPSPFQHFAMFPQALIEPMILAGCPAQVCSACGAPHVRVVERAANYTSRQHRGQPNGTPPQVDSSGWQPATVHDHGFAPGCDCNIPATPGVVIDPFMGSGTTALVAQRLGRDFVGCDLNAEYVELARKRVQYHGDDARMVKEQAAGVEQLSLLEATHED